MFYEPGKTDHGLSHDPFKVSLPHVKWTPRPLPPYTAVDPNRFSCTGMCGAQTDRMDQHRFAVWRTQSRTILTIQQFDI